jgi:hypothetical protein
MVGCYRNNIRYWFSIVFSCRNGATGCASGTRIPKHLRHIRAGKSPSPKEKKSGEGKRNQKGGHQYAKIYACKKKGENVNLRNKVAIAIATIGIGLAMFAALASGDTVLFMAMLFSGLSLMMLGMILTNETSECQESPPNPPMSVETTDVLSPRYEHLRGDVRS